jgi:hypothetical protein
VLELVNLTDGPRMSRFCGVMNRSESYAAPGFEV